MTYRHDVGLVFQILDLHSRAEDSQGQRAEGKSKKKRCESQEKTIELECIVVMKRWVQYAKEVDWSVFLGRKAVVVTPAAGGKSGDSVS